MFKFARVCCLLSPISEREAFCAWLFLLRYRCEKSQFGRGRQDWLHFHLVALRASPAITYDYKRWAIDRQFWHRVCLN
jgi:hypothetical protein